MKCQLGYCYCSLKVSRTAPLSFTNHNSVFWSRMFQNNRNIRSRYEISSKLSVLILNFEHILHLVLVFAQLSLNSEMSAMLQLLQSQGKQNSTNHNSVLQSRMFQNNRNTRTWYEISSKLTISVSIVNFERILHLITVFALLTLNSQMLPEIYYCSLKVSRTAPLFLQITIVCCGLGCFRIIETRCEICSKLTISVFMVNFKHVSQLVLAFALLTLNSEVTSRMLLLLSQGQWNSTFVFHKSQQCIAVQDALEQQKHQNKSSKLIISAFIVNFEHILRLVPVFVLLTLNSQMLAGIFLFQSQGEQISTFIFTNHNSVAIQNVLKGSEQFVYQDVSYHTKSAINSHQK